MFRLLFVLLYIRAVTPNPINLPCQTVAGTQGSCIPLTQCPVLLKIHLDRNASESDLQQLQASACDVTHEAFACCELPKINVTEKNAANQTTATAAPAVERVTKEPTESTTETAHSSIERKYKEHVRKGTLPRAKYCGLQHTDDRVRDKDDNMTALDEFPWMVILPTKASGHEFTLSCTGALISTKFILTHIVCASFIDVVARLGLYNSRENVSCVNSDPTYEECTEVALDRKVVGKFLNEDYDLGLLELDEGVPFSDFIRPICLPFNQSELPRLGDEVIVSGWASNNTELGVPKKKLVYTIADKGQCFFNDSSAFIREIQLCGVPHANNSLCLLDWGGPIMYKRKRRWFIMGVHTVLDLEPFAEQPCTDKPEAVYGNRITNSVLEWILNTIT